MVTGRRTRDDAESTWARAKPLFLAAFLAIATIVGLRLLVELRHLLILLFISLVLAAAISRPADVLERRRIPRGIAVAIVQPRPLAHRAARGQRGIVGRSTRRTMAWRLADVLTGGSVRRLNR